MLTRFLLIGSLALAGCEAPDSVNNGAQGNDSSLTAGNMTSTGEAPAAAVAAEAPPAATPLSAPQDTSRWNYTERRDEMRNSSARLASISAEEPIRLAFPYGESTPELTIRQDPKYGFDIFVTANGQFLCRSYDDDVVSVKFDNGPIESWACANAESGSSDIVFISNARSFLAKLKKAKRVVIEADMYDAGRQQMAFAVAGLKWENGGKSSD
jgi:hypothetical protein